MVLKLLRADPRLIDLRELCFNCLEELAVLQNLKHTQWNHKVVPLDKTMSDLVTIMSVRA